MRLTSRLRAPNRNIYIKLTCQTPTFLTTHIYWFVDYFNCVIETIDISGHFQNSRALTEIIRGLEFKDAWNQDLSRLTYTYYHSSVASRMDILYITKDLHTRKTGKAVLAATFTGHLEFELRVVIPDAVLSRLRYRWKIHPNLTNDPQLRHKISIEWMRGSNVRDSILTLHNRGKGIWRNGYEYSSG
jgi:hypothetical protein